MLVLLLLSDVMHCVDMWMLLYRCHLMSGTALIISWNDFWSIVDVLTNNKNNNKIIIIIRQVIPHKFTKVANAHLVDTF